jgi:RNA polymerase sigma-70 factor (ECF subfamily)
LGPFLESEWTLSQTVDEAFDVDGITDVQLRMMFSCIHPQLPEETQLALVLHLVCGFGMDETAVAFLKKGAAMQKRLRRAKTALARSKKLFDVVGTRDVAAAPPACDARAIYLLFNEGYHGASAQSTVRVELCAEALRLVSLLLEYPVTSTSTTHALAALLNFLAARLSERVDAAVSNPAHWIKTAPAVIRCSSRRGSGSSNCPRVALK